MAVGRNRAYFMYFMGIPPIDVNVVYGSWSPSCARYTTVAGQAIQQLRENLHRRHERCGHAQFVGTHMHMALRLQQRVAPLGIQIEPHVRRDIAGWKPKMKPVRANHKEIGATRHRHGEAHSRAVVPHEELIRCLSFVQGGAAEDLRDQSAFMPRSFLKLQKAHSRAAPNLASWIGGSVWSIDLASDALDEEERRSRLATLREWSGLSDSEVVQMAQEGNLPAEPEYVEWLVLLGREDLVGR